MFIAYELMPKCAFFQEDFFLGTLAIQKKCQLERMSFKPATSGDVVAS